MADLLARLQEALASRYRIERELGRGGMATVFLAEDLKHHRPVAIKVLDPELAAAIGPERFLREIETAARLNHPQILPLHDSGAAEGLLYYVMPYVEGESLRERLGREKQLPLDDALRITREVVDALDYAHSQGVVHRDIKPENILLSRGHAVVADFGIARAIRAAGGPKLTETGLMLGTPPYMSPEQAIGGGEADARSDQYSLGCVLYEMLAGQPPFTGPTGESVVHQHLSVAPRSVADLRPAVPAGIAQALGRSLAKTPADRFATLAAFAEALAAPPGSGAPGARISAGRRRMSFALGAWVLVLLAVAAFAAWKSGLLSDLARGRPAPATMKDWILVAEFDGPTGNPSLARAARELVSAAIDQSAGMATVPRDQIRVALEQAGKPDTLRLTPGLAREIAYRGAVRAVLEGEVVALGGRYTVTLRVTDVEEDKQLLSLTDVARSEDDLIPVLRRMGARIRERFEQGPGMIRTTRANTQPVATSSFEAYRRWVEGIRIYDEFDFAGAFKLYREALAIDPEFGAGWGNLAFAYMGLGQPDSALAAAEEAMRHPRSLTPANRLYLEGLTAWWKGDARGAKETFDRVVRLYPRSYEARFAINNWSLVLVAEGRLSDALETEHRMDQFQVFGTSQVDQYVRVRFLTSLGRLAEARSAIVGLRGGPRKLLDLDLALAEAGWDEADSLATLHEQAAGTSLVLLAESATARAQVAAVRGEVDAAEAGLQQAERLEHERGRPSQAARRARPRALLALLSGRAVPRPEPWLERDTTTSALITRAYLAAAAGDTALAGRLLTKLRVRSTTRLGAHGSTPEFIESCIAARSGRWSDVVGRIARPAREGSDRGRPGSEPTADRIGVPAERWLVAQAYERLGQPDSAAAFYLRMLGPEQPGVGWTALVRSFVHQRLVMLYTHMGRLAEAERHLAMLERDFTRPDPDVRHLLDEARAAVRSAQGMAKSATR
jgi:tetratricopeptide (TPR) repeat protein